MVFTWETVSPALWEQHGVRNQGTSGWCKHIPSPGYKSMAPICTGTDSLWGLGMLAPGLLVPPPSLDRKYTQFFAQYHHCKALGVGTAVAVDGVTVPLNRQVVWFCERHVSSAYLGSNQNKVQREMKHELMEAAFWKRDVPSSHC